MPAKEKHQSRPTVPLRTVAAIQHTSIIMNRWLHVVIARGQLKNHMSHSQASLQPYVTPQYKEALRVRGEWVPRPRRPRDCNVRESSLLKTTLQMNDI